MEKYFDGIDEIKISNQIVGKRLYVNLIKKINTRFGINYLCYDKKHNCALFGNSLLKAFLNKIICNLTTKDNVYYCMDPKLSLILALKITSCEKDKKTGKLYQKFDLKSSLSNGKMTKSDAVLELSDDGNDE